MASKLVNDRVKDAEHVISAAGHADAVENATLVLVAPLLLTGETSPEIAKLIRLGIRSLEQACKKMIEADAAHTAELGDDDAPRLARDQATSDLRERLIALRAFFAGLFAPTEMTKLGFTQGTPEDPVMLSAFSGEVFTALDKPLPPTKKKGLSYDASSDEDLASAKEAKTKLDEALSSVKREAREAEATLIAKNRAIDDFDETFSNVVSLLVGLFSFAKQYELADRIRPLARRHTPTPTPTPTAS